jgi:ribonucleotide monophosphatase NagD (HAD superfamily)
MTADRLREALRGVRGFVLDADGVLVLKGAAVPGAVEAIRVLQARDIPFRVVTNFSLAHRDSLAERFTAGGLAIGADQIITGTSAAAAHTAEHHPDRAGRASRVRRPTPGDRRGGGRGTTRNGRGGRHWRCR